MTSFNSQMRLPNEEIVKCVSKYCLETAIIARQEQRQLNESYTASHSAVCTVQGITLLRPSNLIRSNNRHVKHSVMYIYFVREYAEDFHCGNLHEGEIVQMCRRNAEYSLPVFQFLRNRACLRVTGCRVQPLL